MILIRQYRSEDATIICSWIRSEDELYKWSADRYNMFPLPDYMMNISYSEQLKDGRFFPFTAVDDNDNVVGHFIIRYPCEGDDTTVRFGFVIIDPKYRGRGYGKEMLKRGIKYVKEELKATKIDLGVFENNPGANHLYKSLGFKTYGYKNVEMPAGTWKCIEMVLNLHD